MMSKARLIEAVCGINLREEFNHLPTTDLEHSMVSETPEVFALLAEAIAEDKNELEIKKMELENSLKLEKFKIQCSYQRDVDLAKIEANKSLVMEKVQSRERISRHQWSFVPIIMITTTLLGIAYFAL